MSRFSVSERARIALLSADRSRRTLVARALYSPLVRWRFGSAAARDLLIVPQDLRTADPSFWQEMQLGHFGLAGSNAALGTRSPFELRPPNEAWSRALHGFGWLRHLEAAGDDEARTAAQRLAVEWTVRFRSGGGVAWQPAVIGRRLISWISHSTLLLDGTDHASYDAVTQSLGAQIVRLSASWRDGPDGYPRLLALTALVLADLSITGHDRRLAEAEAALTAELRRQVLADGGHISRNPAVLVDVMLDLLPLRQCFVARGRQPPAVLIDCIQRIISMLRYLRMGDGLLARFNGVSVASPAGLATVLGYDDRPGFMIGSAPQSGYVRLERCRSVVIVDAGGPPPIELAGEAHAGCLSFEMSSGTSLIFINGGAPVASGRDWRPVARATSSHNTLCLGEASSSRLVRHARLESLIGAPPIRQPNVVTSYLEEHGGNLEFTGTHDGYMERQGLVHSRSLVLNAAGTRLAGSDKLSGSRGPVRLRTDVPFAIHFHLHPHVSCKRGQEVGTAEIATRDGRRWSFTVSGSALTIEESTYFADSAGPRRSLQLVVRGATFGETHVRWVMEEKL